MILVVTPEAMQSPHVRHEWQTFVLAGKPIIPVILRKATLPPQLQCIQCIRVNNRNYGKVIYKLREALKAISLPDLGSASGAIADGGEQPIRGIDLRQLVIALAAIGLLIAVLVMIDQWVGNDDKNNSRPPGIPGATNTPVQLKIERSADTIAICADQDVDLGTLEVRIGSTESYVLGGVFPASTTTQAEGCWCLQLPEPLFLVPGVCDGDNTRIMPENSSERWGSKAVTLWLAGKAFNTCPAQPDQEIYVCSVEMQ